MYSSKNPKISQHTRTQIWLQYNSNSKLTQATLALQCGVSRQTVSKIIHRARDGDFNIHKPINHRYLTAEYIKKRQQKLQLKIAQKALRKAKREEVQKSRYEHKNPGDLGHMDLKLLPPILGEKIVKGQKEYLLTLVDDATRQAHFELIQGKNQHQVKAGLERIFARSSIEYKAILSDNGKEFKGKQKQENGFYKPKTEVEGQQHVVELLLQERNIKHRYTRVRRPQTNGKVERLNRTIAQEFLTKMKFENRLHREAQLRLWEYHYNNNRQHQGIKNQTPHQKLIQLSPLKFM
jgi:transposase InsO family protein